MTNQELVTQWNKQHAPGSHVRMLRAGKRPLDTTTKSMAFVREDKAMIRVDGIGVVELETLQVMERGKK